MREIKFRAWAGGIPTYFNLFNTTGQLNSTEGKAQFRRRESPQHTVSEDCPIDQYTGLKDKNGKEIYEGDIISNCYIKRAVEYSGAGFNPFFEMLDVRDGFTILGGLYNFEVIGNIYENPELLK